MSSATILIMVLVIFLATLLFLLRPASEILISELQDKVDISVYFKKDILSEEIAEVRAEVSRIPEVKNVEYVSREEAIEKFVLRYKDDPILMESLVEAGENPFLASLSIRAWQASQYEQVAAFLETGPFINLIDKIDYYQRKPVIEKVFSLTDGINRAGITFTIILGVIAALVAFNTVRLAICNTSQEISVMRLVGASNRFIRGPFLIQGIIIGLIATIITLLITLAVCYGFDSKVKIIAPNVSIFNIFLTNFWNLFLIQLVTGVGLGAMSSLIAVRKYLKM